MRKSLIFRRVALCALCALMFSGAAFGAGRQEMKRLGVFISNFTEAGLFNFDIRAENSDDGLLHMGMPENVTELARFGIVHNYINNRSRIRKCRDRNCESGPLVIDKKFVAESVSKYFGLELDNMDLDSIADNVTAEFSYDGKFFHFDPESFTDPGENAVYYAEVEDVDEGGRYTAVSGYVYDSRKTTRRRGNFSAMVIPSEWKGKSSWLIIRMTTDWEDD